MNNFDEIRQHATKALQKRRPTSSLLPADWIIVALLIVLIIETLTHLK